jgi:hypothetical protein
VAYTYEQIIRAQYEVAEAEHASANAALEDARLREDPHDVQAAVDRIIANNNVVQQLNQAAMTMQRQQQPSAYGFDSDTPRKHVELAQRHGVSPDRIGIALNWTTDQGMSDDEKVRTYMENVRRLAHERATGQYRDDQGTVKR